jgi:hypothetical protein
MEVGACRSAKQEVSVLFSSEVLGKAFCYKTTVFTIKAYVLNFLFCNTGV